MNISLISGAIRRQQGVVLFIALIMLVAMSIAGIGLMRSVGGGVLLAGNLSMKQSTTRAADLGFEQAKKWVVDTASGAAVDLETNHVAQGYIATGLTAFNPTGLGTTWWSANSRSMPAAGSGPFQDYQIQYVVHRLCALTGPPTGGTQQCVRHATPPPPCSLPTGCPEGAFYVLYRVTTRITGPKNTESYVQVTFY